MRMKSIARFRWPQVAAAAAVVVFGLSVFAATAPAALSVTGGTLHVYAQFGSFISAPPDKPFTAPTTSATAMVGIFLNDGAANETVSFTGGQASISTYTFFNTSEVASGNLALTENTSETLLLHVNSGTVGPYYLGLISLDAVGGGNLFSHQFVPSNFLPQYDFLIPVTAGQYTLSWSDTGTTFLGQGGGGGFDFTMSATPAPEPTGVVLLGVGWASILFRRRRR